MSKSSKDKNKELKQIFAAIFENSADSIIIVDLKGRIINWNKGAKSLYGYSKAEALKMNILELSPPQSKEQLRIILNEIRSGQKIKIFETKRITKNGRVLDVEMTLTELKKKNRIFAVANIERDITERLHMIAFLKEFPGKMISAQEDTQRKIAQGLHDDLGQSLIALKMYLSSEISESAKGNIGLRKFLEQIQARVAEIIDKTRDLSHDLYPPNLKYVGLSAAVGKMIKSMNYDKNVKIKFVHRNVGKADINSTGIVAYRIVQEALSNAIKHADATEISIKIMYRQQDLFMEIRDNGRGYEKASLKNVSGIGLALMRERVKLLNGFLTIDSGAGKGTTIRIVIPVSEKK